MIILDDFNRPNDSNLGINWITSLSNLAEISNNQLRLLKANGASNLFYPTNVTGKISFNINTDTTDMTTDNRFVFLFNIQNINDISNFYTSMYGLYIELGPIVYFDLFKYDGVGVSKIGSTISIPSLSPNTTIRIDTLTVSNGLNFYINNELKTINAGDNTFSTSQGIGFKLYLINSVNKPLIDDLIFEACLPLECKISIL